MVRIDFPEYWRDATVVVAGSGSGLTKDVAYRCEELTCLAVNDAVRLLPSASVLYAADSDWWQFYSGIPYFHGQRWSITEERESERARKLALAADLKINLVQGLAKPGFSTDRNFVHYGNNSGFQAINLAMNFGAKRIILVGFNMGGTHFFGKHPIPLRNGDPESFIRHFDEAAKLGHPDVEIINATPNSMLRCFPFMPLEHALALS